MAAGVIREMPPGGRRGSMGVVLVLVVFVPVCDFVLFLPDPEAAAVSDAAASLSFLSVAEASAVSDAAAESAAGVIEALSVTLVAD